MVATQASGGEGCVLDRAVSATAKTTLVVITLANIFWGTTMYTSYSCHFISNHPMMSVLQYHLHFTNKETETQRYSIHCPRSHNAEVLGTGLTQAARSPRHSHESYGYVLPDTAPGSSSVVNPITLVKSPFFYNGGGGGY